MHRNVYDRILLLSDNLLFVYQHLPPFHGYSPCGDLLGIENLKHLGEKKSQEVRKPKLCHHCGITEGFKGEDLKQKESTVGMVWIVSGVDSFSYQLTYHIMEKYL